MSVASGNRVPVGAGPDGSNAFAVGLYNSAFGDKALFSTTTGAYNTGSGYLALFSNTTGSDNAAFGAGALYANTGNSNTASGESALGNNTNGSNNTAAGFQALIGAAISGANPNGATGSNNTGIGANALFSYSTGNDNTAAGDSALYSNTTGSFGTASGYGALFSNTTSYYNTATGFEALYSNNGGSNTASGYEALYLNKNGNDNTATGVNALHNNTSGSNNIAEGWHGGYNLTTGSNNIDIGNIGAAADTNTIKIGTQGTQTKTLIAGIFNNTSVSGMYVVVDSTGQLGVSSTPPGAGVKTAISPMGSSSEKLQKLRPVTFHLKSDPKGALQYGLIAEEVARVYPDLVVRNESGRIDSVRYDELAPVLLNEVQQQQRKMTAQEVKSAAQAERIAAQDQHLAGEAAEIRGLKEQQLRMQRQVTELKELNQATQVALKKLQAQDPMVARR
jgi:hypothetical protein